MNVFRVSWTPHHPTMDHIYQYIEASLLNYVVKYAILKLFSFSTIIVVTLGWIYKYDDSVLSSYNAGWIAWSAFFIDLSKPWLNSGE